MKTTFTKGEIDRLGERIRTEKYAITNITLEELQGYRISHKETLSRVFGALCTVTKKFQPTSIVTYRIKRFESIIGKLHRYPQMKFSRMWDIGGCRCILKNDKEVYKMRELIKEHLEIRKEYDYIKEPQSEGYKSLHLFVSLPHDNQVIEVQLRNQVDHNWATLVEISDFLFDAKLKEYGENKDLLRFHYLLSRIDHLTIHDKYEIAKIIKKYEYFDKLSSVFAKNYIQVRKQWYNIESQKKHKFFLIETKKGDIPKIEPFESFNQAEVNYFSIYKSAGNANVVLTHLTTPNYKHISIAYSNYILTFHTFLQECHQILESLIVESLQSRKYFAFFTVYSLYKNLLINHIRNLVAEIVEVTRIINTSPVNKRRDGRKEREWVNDIKTEVSKSQERARKLQLAVNRNMPKSDFGKFIINGIVKQIDGRSKKRIKKLIEKIK